MFPANNGLPTPLSTLEDLLEDTDTSVRPEKVFVGHNLGGRTFLAFIPMKDFYSMSKVANERQADGTPATQRPLNELHATNLAKYILKGLVSAAIQARRNFKKTESATLLAFQQNMGTQAYLSLQPLVANLRTCNAGGSGIKADRMEANGETAAFKVFLRQQDMLYIIDGQHRRYAMDMVFEFLNEVRLGRKYPKKPKLYVSLDKGILSPEILSAWEECDEVARSFCKVAVEIHLGLDPRQEQQLFHDLNNLAKRVEKSLALKFDSANSINHFIQEELIQGILGWDDVIDSDTSDWHQDSGKWTFKDLAAVNAILFLNKTNISTATPADVEPKKEIARRFWETISSIHGFGEDGARMKTAAAQPVVIKALAKLTYDFAYGKKRESGSEKHLETVLDGIANIDFSHTNPCWRYYTLSDAERIENKLESLKSYLPQEDGSNRDLGGYDMTNSWMRFGSKHNDIYPIIGDMIRWNLGLPSRHTPN
jgi:hypothetical protein